ERESLLANLAALPERSVAELRDHWSALYGKAPPVRISHLLLVQAVAYRMQELALGGLKPPIKKRLLEYLDASQSPAACNRHHSATKSGTMLLREWQGIT